MNPPYTPRPLFQSSVNLLSTFATHPHHGRRFLLLLFLPENFCFVFDRSKKKRIKGARVIIGMVPSRTRQRERERESRYIDGRTHIGRRHVLGRFVYASRDSVKSWKFCREMLLLHQDEPLSISIRALSSLNTVNKPSTTGHMEHVAHGLPFTLVSVCVRMPRYKQMDAPKALESLYTGKCEPRKEFRGPLSLFSYLFIRPVSACVDFFFRDGQDQRRGLPM